MYWGRRKQTASYAKETAQKTVQFKVIQIDGVSVSGEAIGRKDSTNVYWAPSDTQIQFWEHSRELGTQNPWPPGVHAPDVNLVGNQMSAEPPITQTTKVQWGMAPLPTLLEESVAYASKLQERNDHYPLSSQM